MNSRNALNFIYFFHYLLKLNNFIKILSLKIKKMTSSITKYLLITLVLASSINFIFSKPIIGILTNPMIDETDDIKESFINLSYVKWLETAGAEIVPIHPWFSDIELDNILGKVNGILFQGGSASLRIDFPFAITATKILRRVIKEKDENNKILPLWGTCLGFELLHVIISGSSSVLSNFNAYNTLSSLLLNSDANKTSKLYSLFSDQDVLNIKSESLTAQYHHWGVGLKQYQIFDDLDNFFVQTSFAYDLDNQLYIASVEAKHYPIYGTQFHSEKTSYDRGSEDNVPQGIDAVRISHNFANYFVNTARSNSNTMTNEEMKGFDMINSFEKTTEKKGTSIVYIYKKPVKKDFKTIKFLN